MSLPRSIKEKFSKELKGELLFDEPLARYTTVKVGGPADALLYPAGLEDLKVALQICEKHEIPYFVIGNGSNLLVKDGGVRGLVIKLNRCLNAFRVEEEGEKETVLYAESGYSLPKVVEYSRQNGLSGIESLFGVPGTVGGAIIMNAGTREGEIGECIEELTVMDSSGDLKTYLKKRLNFEYRSLKIPRSEIAIGVKLRLQKSDPQKVAERIGFFQKRRLDTQPLDQPSMGSVFKNPPKKFAAQLIEELGLKGVRVGGARVSEKHSNWIVNEGNATAKDILVLIGLVRDKVKEVTDIRLETEVKIIGEDKPTQEGLKVA
ncbi:MAG: UDP-N-acetylmuramate dehydrogenase [bacterium]